MVMKKKGMWRIVEATIAVLLVASMIFFLIASQKTSRENFDAFELIKPSMNEIAKNNSVREAVLLDSSSSSDAENIILILLSQRISNPSLQYNVTICDAFTANPCGLPGDYPSSVPEVYIEERIISATLTQFTPKIVKLYVWQTP